MTSKEDISEELKQHRVKRNCHHLEKIISSINDSMNLFMLIIEKEYLFNIANGKRCKCKPQKGTVSLNQNQAKKLDSSKMKPCSKVLHQKIMWCIYGASVWTNSLRMEPTPHLPTPFGWTLDEDKIYYIKWFESDVVPKIVEVIKDDSCTGYGEFSNSKIQRRLLQNNGDTKFDHSAFFFISSNQKLFFNFL